MKHTQLTVDFINANIGKTIEWYCFGYHANLPYKGKCRLLGWVEDARLGMRPVVEKLNSGPCDLNWAWIEGAGLTYSDAGRPVYLGSCFKIYTISWDVPKHGLYRSEGNGMQHSIVVYDGQDAQAIARTKTTAKEFDLVESI